jgi:hypothetical protein
MSDHGYVSTNICHSRYVEFDFHRETKGMKFENIAKLSSQLTEDISKMGYALFLLPTIMNFLRGCLT